MLKPFAPNSTEAGAWKVFMVNTVKKNADGSFETVKIRVGKDQNAKDRVRSFMVKMFYEA